MSNKLVKNVLGRLIPTEINGEKVIPFKGVGQHVPQGVKYAPPIASSVNFQENGDKLVSSLEEALKLCGLKSGMTISTHHHLRNGDLVTNKIFDIAKQQGLNDLVWFPSASFSCHEHLLPYLNDGTINRIEGSIAGALGKFCSQGKMKGMAVMRSHGGRVQAIQDGEVKINIAVLAAPSADFFGNATGQLGTSACGVLGYAKADYLYADKVIVVTDNLIDFPCMPMEIEGNYVDYVVQIDRIAIPEKIINHTTKLTKSPDKQLIAELSSKFLIESGILQNNVNMQTGAEGTSLAIANNVHNVLKDKGWKTGIGFGGSNKFMVRMLEEGTLEHILDTQTFDLDAVKSISVNNNHHIFPVFNAYNYHSKGNITSMMDIMILGATEVDVNYNGNIVTSSDGYISNSIGGWQNCLHAKNVIIAIPLFRDRVSHIKDEVTTICGPGEMIDVVVTERGIAINPQRKDLLDRMRGSDLPIKTIEELKKEADQICGIAQKLNTTNDIIAAVKWVDGTVIDVIRKVPD